MKEAIEPIKIFPLNTNSEENTIQAMLETFEQKQISVPSALNQANVIIMKVESEEKDQLMDDNNRNDNGYIVGGYASHGWSASFNLRGDDSCFLFNLTHNLRFNALKG